LLSKPWRFIICTPENTGNLKKEKLAPHKGTGDSENKKTNLINFEIKNQTLKKFAPLIENLLNLKFALILIGLILILLVKGGLVFKIEPASAASPLADLTLARQIVQDIRPAVITREQIISPAISSVDDGYLVKPLIAETQVTEEEKPKVQRRTNLRKASSSRAPESGLSSKITNEPVANRFPFGYCTYYVAQKRPIPWRGNAITWLSGARAFGFATGETPQVGAIVVTTEGGATGHVAMVDAVAGDQMTISEMNFRGFGVISSRTIPISYSRIIGYIY